MWRAICRCNLTTKGVALSSKSGLIWTMTLTKMLRRREEDDVLKVKRIGLKCISTVDSLPQSHLYQRSLWVQSCSPSWHVVQIYTASGKYGWENCNRPKSLSSLCNKTHFRSSTHWTIARQNIMSLVITKRSFVVMKLHADALSRTLSLMTTSGISCPSTYF